MKSFPMHLGWSHKNFLTSTRLTMWPMILFRKNNQLQLSPLSLWVFFQSCGLRSWKQCWTSFNFSCSVVYLEIWYLTREQNFWLILESFVCFISLSCWICFVIVFLWFKNSFVSCNLWQFTFYVFAAMLMLVEQGMMSMNLLVWDTVFLHSQLLCFSVTYNYLKQAAILG